jgi:hypothetical protein
MKPTAKFDDAKYARFLLRILRLRLRFGLTETQARVLVGAGCFGGGHA